jgi:hypothetical protein
MSNRIGSATRIPPLAPVFNAILAESWQRQRDDRAAVFTRFLGVGSTANQTPSASAMGSHGGACGSRAA